MKWTYIGRDYLTADVGKLTLYASKDEEGTWMVVNAFPPTSVRGFGPTLDEALEDYASACRARAAEFNLMASAAVLMQAAE